MHTEVKRSELLHALAAADGVARPSQMPLLECVLITATGKGEVTVAATDTAMTIRSTIASTNRKEGSIAMPAKRLRDVVKGAPGESISLTVLDNAWIEIKSGAARYKLAGYVGRDFPKIPEPGKGKRIAIAGETLKALIDRVLFSTSDDKTRMQLNGALFEVRGGLASMVSTDGHRLTRATCSIDADDFTALVPKDALAKLAKIAEGDVEIIVEPARIFACVAGLTMSTPLTDHPFPPYDQVIPKSFEATLTVDRAALIASIERTKIACGETRGTGIDGRDGVLVLSSEHPDVGEVSDEIAAEGATSAVTSCVAPKYLIDALSHTSDDTVRLKFSGELSPLLIEGATSSNYTAIVMPMRR